MTTENERALLGVVAPPEERSAGVAEDAVRGSLAAVRAELAALRSQREETNAEIKRLVEEEETLAQAAGVFDRRRQALVGTPLPRLPKGDES